MMDAGVAVRLLTAEEADEKAGALAEVLMDCVEGGASVSFMASLSREKAQSFWRRVAKGVQGGERLLLIAEESATGRVVGTVQVIFAPFENQPHRADVAKMLVHRRARRQGIGAMLMRAAEEAARAAGKSLLVLDTVTGTEAYRLYLRLGWTRVGEIPNYALWPDGRPCPTTYFYKAIG